MPKYLWQVTYAPQGPFGAADPDAATARCETIRQMVEAVGGSVEVCYFSFGGEDLYVIGEVPDEIAAASLSIHASVGGAARSWAVQLLTSEQMDRATQMATATRRSPDRPSQRSA